MPYERQVLVVRLQTTEVNGKVYSLCRTGFARRRRATGPLTGRGGGINSLLGVSRGRISTQLQGLLHSQPGREHHAERGMQHAVFPAVLAAGQQEPGHLHMQPELVGLSGGHHGGHRQDRRGSSRTDVLFQPVRAERVPEDDQGQAGLSRLHPESEHRHQQLHRQPEEHLPELQRVPEHGHDGRRIQHRSVLHAFRWHHQQHDRRFFGDPGCDLCPRRIYPRRDQRSGRDYSNYYGEQDRHLTTRFRRGRRDGVPVTNRRCVDCIPHLPDTNSSAAAIQDDLRLLAEHRSVEGMPARLTKIMRVYASPLPTGQQCVGKELLFKLVTATGQEQNQDTAQCSTLR